MMNESVLLNFTINETELWFTTMNNNNGSDSLLTNNMKEDLQVYYVTGKCNYFITLNFSIIINTFLKKTGIISSSLWCRLFLDSQFWSSQSCVWYKNGTSTTTENNRKCIIKLSGHQSKHFCIFFNRKTFLSLKFFSSQWLDIYLVFQKI